MNGAGGVPTDTDLVRRVHAVFGHHRDIGVDTNFFEAGFSSAMLTEVLTGLHGIGLRFTLIDLYRYPTVRQLAAAAGQQTATNATPSLPWLRQPPAN